MASEKTTYWMALGIVALLLGNHFVQKADWNCYRVRAFTAMQRISDSGNRMTDRIQASLNRSSSRCERVQSRVAYAEARIASAQCLLAEKQAALAQAEALRQQQVLIINRMHDPVLRPLPRVNVVVPGPVETGDNDPI